jgi:hypothetical protein
VYSPTGMKGQRGFLVGLRTPRVWQLTAGLSACVVLALPTAAAAITRAQADLIAARALKTSQQPGNAVLFGLSRALGSADTVVEAGGTRPNEHQRRRSLKALDRRAWVFWEDLNYGAALDHPTRLLLLDDRTGRVGRPIALSSYPLIDARPAFLGATVRTNRRYRGASIVAQSARAGFGSFPAWAANGPLASSADTAPAPLALPPGAFQDVCILTIGDDGPDPSIRAGFPLLNAEAHRLGVPLVVNTQSKTPGKPANKNDFFRTAHDLATRYHCKDILLYIAGHGYKNFGGVNVGEVAKPAGAGKVDVQDIDITPLDILDIIDHNPEVKFKVKVDSCYSGHFTDELRKFHSLIPNLLVAEASSSATLPSYFHVNRQGNSVSSDGLLFTHANITAWENFATSPTAVATAEAAGGDLFAEMMSTAFKDELTYDPRLMPELYVSPPPTPTPTLTGSGSFTYFDPPANTEIVFHVSFDMPTSGFDIEVPGGYQITNTLPPSGGSGQISSRDGGTNNFYSVTLATPANTVVQGNLQTSPAPAPGMGGTLFARLPSNVAMPDEVAHMTGPP